MLTYVLLVFVAVLYAEVAGYCVHTLLHLTPESMEKNRLTRSFRWVTRFHMGHHAVGYGVRMVQRPSTKFVRNPEHEKRSKTGFLMPEFSLPAIPFIGLFVLALWLVGLTWWHIGFTLLMTGLWVGFSFLYVHDAFHQSNHWLGRVPIVRWWFRKMRAAHDRHHTMLDRHGLVPYNMGISLPLMDWMFRTWIPAGDPTVTMEDFTGQIVDTSYTEARYAKFHETYQINEPEFDANVDDDVRDLLKDYRPASDRPIVELED